MNFGINGMKLKRKLKREFIVTSVIILLIELVTCLIIDLKYLSIGDILIAAIGAYLTVMSLLIVIDLIFISLTWIDEEYSYIKLLKSYYFEEASNCK